jgi:hypothetical protein
MLKDFQSVIDKLEQKRQAIIEDVQSVSEDQLRFKSGPDKWSLMQELQHIVGAERGIRRSEEALRDNPVREKLEPGKMVEVVKNVLENDVPIDVPDPSFEPDGKTSLSDLQALWRQERKLLWALFESINAKNADNVMFSHPATGPLTPMQTLELALAHLDNHHRRLKNQLQGA